jgi:CheY-like chemotaxis protein
MDGSIPAEADLRPLRHTARMMQPVQTLRCKIVDDSRAFLTIAALVLERDGVAVVATATGSAEALECLERLRPDVMLVDIKLGGESGFDLARAIHRQPSVAVPVPAVILTWPTTSGTSRTKWRPARHQGSFQVETIGRGDPGCDWPGSRNVNTKQARRRRRMRAGSNTCGGKILVSAGIRRWRWQCSLASSHHQDNLSGVAAMTLMLELHLPLIHVRWIRLLAGTTELGNGDSGSAALSHRLSAFGRDFRRSA